MRRFFAAVFALSIPAAGFAEGLRVEDAYVPLAPRGAMVHAAYMTISNDGGETRSLIGVTAEGYHMAHLHMTLEQDGVASMAAMHQVSIEPGQVLSLTQGKMHVMLMKPVMPIEEGGEVALQLEFANGEKLPVTAVVKSFRHGS